VSRAAAFSHHARLPAFFAQREADAMIAAIYARKSTDQSMIADESKSVTRQIEHARAYATRKGWSVNEASVFVDDGVSGRSFQTAPDSSD
jgi:hypothetical protein